MATPLSVTRPLATVPIWAWLAATVSLLLFYVVLQENGAVLGQSAELVHEFFHDGRHALGVPCH